MKGVKSSLISRFALSTALMAATVVLLAAIFFHYLKGDLFMGSFSAPLEEWADPRGRRRVSSVSPTSRVRFAPCGAIWPRRSG